MSWRSSCSINTSSLPKRRRSQIISSTSDTSSTLPSSSSTRRRNHRATSHHNSKTMKRLIRQITTFCMVTLAMTALSNAASVRGAAIIRQQDLEDEDVRHAPSVAPTAINDMFAQDLANSSDELPEIWEDRDQSSISTSPNQSTEREHTSMQPFSSKANDIDLLPQEATLSAAAASLDLDSATNVAPPISASSFSLPPRSPDTIRGNTTTSSIDSTLHINNNSSLSSNYELDIDQQNDAPGDAPTDDLDAIMMGGRSNPAIPSSSRKSSQALETSSIDSNDSSSPFDWSSSTTRSYSFLPNTVQGTSRAQLDKSPHIEEAEQRFEENRRIATKLQAAADHALAHDEEQRARQTAKQTALEEMKSRSSKNTAASPASLQSQHKYGLNVRLGQRAAPAQTVYVSPSGDFDTLPAAIYSGSLNIILEEGTHVVDSTVVLGQHQAGISIRGVSKTNKSIVKFVGKESSFVIFNSHNVVLSNLVIDAMNSKNPNVDEEEYDGQMWQVVGVVNSSQVGIIDCTIRSPSSMYAIFFAGAFYAPRRLYQPFFGDTLSRFKSEEETVEAYRGGYLDDQNVVRNCNIYSDFQGDAIFFAFQRNGEVSGNKIVQASISVYMNRDTKISENTVNSSPLYGIHVSLPSDNVFIESNKITGSGGSGIKVARVDLEDLEDQTIPSVNTQERPDYRATGIKLIDNAIALSSTIGIEIEMTHGALIAENTVSRTLYSAIYLQHSDQTIVHDNRLEDFGLIAPKHEHNGGIYAAAAITHASIHDNIVIEPLNHGSQYGIKVADLPENTGNSVSENMLSGEYLAGASISAPLRAIMPDNTMM